MDLLNAIAVKSLMAYSALLGIHPLPEPSPNWKLIQPWEFKSDVYSAVVSSESIIEDCSQHPSWYVDFPVVVDGAHEIFLDRKKILSVGQPDIKAVRSFYGTPYLRCSELVGGKELLWKAYAYTRYFSRIAYYPKIVPKKPIRNIFNEIFQITSAGALFFLALISFIVAVGKLPARLVITFSASSFLLSAYFYFCADSFFGNYRPAIDSNRLAQLTVWSGFLLYFYNLSYLKVLPTRIRNFCCSFILVGLVVVAIGNKIDTLQFGTFLPFISVFIVLIYLFISQLLALRNSSSKLGIVKAISLGCWILAFMNDILVISGFVDGYVMLELGTLAGVVFFVIVLNDAIVSTYRERDYLRSNLEKEVDRKTSELNSKTKDLERTLTELESTQDELLHISSQVAHDIRSPLTALKLICYDLFELPEDKRLALKDAINRVNDIANTLAYKKLKKRLNSGSLTTQDEAAEKTSTILLAARIDKVITEKRVQYRVRMGIEIHANLTRDSYGLFVKANEVELERVISNLISNSVEAVDDTGEVLIDLTSKGQNAILTIRDNGRGIPAKILEKLGTRGVTYNKRGGSGLGLNHAKTSLEGWNGNLSIDSQVGIGTLVTITIPLTSPPEWFIEQISIQGLSSIVVLDDDVNIHHVWHRRLSNTGLTSQPKLIHFSAPEQLKVWLSGEGSKQNSLLLVDYEFMNEESDGLALIRDWGLKRKAILVTSRYEEESIQTSCTEYGIKLLPKGMAGFIPIVH